MNSEFKPMTKEEFIQHLRYIKERKRQRTLEAQAEYRAMQKETETLRKQLYATLES